MSCCTYSRSATLALQKRKHRRAPCLQVLKARAEARLGEAVDRAVVTVPARLGRRQRLATMSAALHAGIERVNLLQARPCRHLLLDPIC